MALFLSMTYWIVIRLHKGMAGDSDALFYAFMMTCLAFVAYMGTKEPAFVSEYDDRLVIRYLPFRKRVIMFDDIVDYRYPVTITTAFGAAYGKGRRMSGHRILQKGDEVVELYDTFIGMEKFALKWNSMKNIPQNVSKYILGDYDFSFNTDWKRTLNFPTVLVLLVVYVPAIRRMIAHPSSLMVGIMIPVFMFTIYVLCRPMTKIMVKDNSLIIKNSILGRCKEVTPLSEIDWISVNDRDLFVMTRGTDIAKIPHMLSDTDKALFTEKLRAIGICVLC